MQRDKPVGLSRFELTKAVALENGGQHPGSFPCFAEGGNSNNQKAELSAEDVKFDGIDGSDKCLHVVDGSRLNIVMAAMRGH